MPRNSISATDNVLDCQIQLTDNNATGTARGVLPSRDSPCKFVNEKIVMLIVLKANRKEKRSRPSL
jgi:hypothetical protein